MCLAHQASDIEQEAAQPQVDDPQIDDVITKQMVKLKPELTKNNTHNISMQMKLGSDLQVVNTTQQALATTEDKTDMPSKLM